MIDLVLVTGFLGSGKTTLLRHWANSNLDLRIAWVVNEFSSRDVDAELLRKDAVDVVSLAGGSIFCRCLVADFVRVMTDLGSGNWDAVVAEASGMADPRALSQLLEETKLDRLFRLSSIVTVVDPGTFPKLLQTLPAARAQVEVADTVLVNKSDLFEKEELDRVVTLVEQIRPGARVRMAVYAAMPFEAIPSPNRPEFSGELAPSANPLFFRQEVRLLEPLDLELLQALVRPLAHSLYRVKGFAEIGGIVRAVDFDGARWNVGEEVPGATEALVFTGSAEKAAEIRRVGSALIEPQPDP